jgi:uncharacterized protein
MRLRIILPAIALLIITACATVNTSPSKTGSASNNAQAQQLLSAGKYREAALSYENEASLMKANRRDVPMVRAADAWEKAGELNKARDALSKSNRKDLEGSDAFLHDLLSAQFLIADKRGNEAVRLLNQNPNAVPENERTRWHSLRSLAFEANGMQFDVAGEQAWLMQGLSAKARTAATRNIERLMSLVPAPELSQKSAQLNASDAIYPYAIRELKKRGMPAPSANLSTPTAGSAARTDAFPPADSDGYRPPAQIALLLPLSGSTAGAGFAVRDGFMSKYYSDDRRRPRVTFYDTAGNADGARKAAQRALNDGAQMLVGPLTREEVNAIAAMTEINVPVLLLNRSTNAVGNGNISFALSPDEEGWITADRLANRKLMNILVFTQRDETAQRTLSAFKDQFRTRGGKIISETYIEGDDAAVTAKVAALLAAPADAGGTPADAMYFTLKAPQARQLMKAMNGNPMMPKVVLSSSFVLNGANASQDVVLNGVQMPELPWLLNQTYGLPSSEAIAKNPNLRGPAQRLYAFGADAWQLSAYFERLQNDAGFSIKGATGNLRIDSLGNVQRDPAWAIFSNGRPRVAAE